MSSRTSSLLLVLAACLAVLLPAAEEPVQLRLDLPGEKTMVLLLTGEPVEVCGGWLQRGPTDMNPVALLVDELTVSGRAISGVVEENIPGKRRRAPHRWTVQLEMGSSTVSGTCAGDEVDGSVSGRVVDLASLRQAEGIDPRCNWPAWRGNGCGVATFDKGQELVEDPRTARFVWLSEALPLPGHTPDHGTVGGYGSFCSWDGKLYLLYYEGSGEEPWKGGRSIDEAWSDLKDKQQRGLLVDYGSKEEWAKAKLSVLADDVLVCIDAASGLRLWERRFVGKGFNWADISGAHFHPCTDGERVYAVGSSGRIYAVDIDSGEPVWETAVPGMDPDGERDAAVAQARSGKGRKDRPLGRYEPFKHAYDITSKPRIIGGVLVLGERGLIGIDPATGQLLWGPLPEVRTGNPFTWTHQGKDLIISSVKYGRGPGPGVVCVDPANGRVLWTNEHIMPEMAQMLIQGDLMFVSGAKNHQSFRELEDGQHGDPSCYRLSLQGAERIWKLETGEQQHASNINAICGVIYRDHVFHKLLSGAAATDRRQGKVVCIDLASGTVKGGIAEGMQAGGAWNETIAGDGRLVHLGYSPVFMYAKADPDDYRQLAYNQEDEDRWCFPGGIPYLVTPILIDGRLIYRSYNHLYCFDLRAR